jgi:ABC-type multidrug transport system fused ATPase/permease subunit
MFPSFFHMADSMLTTSLIFSVVFFVAALVSAFVGLAIRVYMAERVRLEHARDMIGGVTGLVVTLVALVLGLLIWTAFGIFSTQKAELQGIAANALEFNQETREYGPEAAHARALMRADLDYAHRQLWGDDQTKAAAIAASIRNMDSLSVVLDHMEPTTDAQKSLLADAKHNYKAIWQSRILMSLQGVDAVSWPVLYVVSAWTCIAFFLTGLNSKSSRATIAVAALGFFLRSQCDVLDSGTVATLHQQHARLFGRHRPSRSRTRQALKEDRVSFRADATCGRIDVNEVDRPRGAEIGCMKVRSPADCVEKLRLIGASVADSLLVRAGDSADDG